MEPTPRQLHNPVDDPQITLRLKHGIHTIFLFAVLDWKFSRVTSELLAILRDRYPDGLVTSALPKKTTPVPRAPVHDSNDHDIRVAYAAPRNPNDLSQGWKRINVRERDTLADKQLTDLSAVAFALISPEEEDDIVEFQVELPISEDAEYE
ncbi:hypothetical protein B0T17DRAFT_616745 [Bombardia bombarda]|uniref:Uncharacterized protein n=1 Tax=Bombardia bombarda TaxID=252184 RepID=A0AA39WZL6_9PEZI|nr:hypothetical protein B0T17DRAFT_616745 [Bombardia bombarda]